MKSQLFIDSLLLSLSSLETSSAKLLTSSSPLPFKLESLTLLLTSFKSSILKSLTLFLNQSLHLSPNTQSLSQCIQKIGAFAAQTGNKLQKLELCALLKKKIYKKQRDSMMNSISMEGSRVQGGSESRVEGLEDEDLKKLRKSVQLIEKDLGIEQRDDEGSIWVADVVRRSIVSLQMTPIRRYTEVSDTSMRLDDSSINPSWIQQTQKQKQTKVQKGKQRIKTGQTQKSDIRLGAQKLSEKPKQNKAGKTSRNGLGSKGKMGLFDNLLEESVETCFTSNSHLHSHQYSNSQSKAPQL